ncbi:MAG: DUF1501 domain-containing protein, partial [Bacteroidetes bacterium]|nr:DUF1501 domain-containing protein [Bacteroidota bacterium]
MKRRNFVKNVTLAGASAPFLLNNLNFQVVTKKLFGFAKSAEDRVLVIIRMNGGNDGLNTLIPLDGYDNLANLRSNIIIPEAKLLNITSDLALHPAMSGMKNLFDMGRMAVVQNVGYPQQNRSHFRSMDIWNSGVMDPSNTTGWLGRSFDESYPNYPDDYPSNDHPDPFAISMGYDVSATCQGLMGNFSMAIQDPFGTINLGQSSVTNDGTYYGSHMEYISTLIAQSNSYGTQINAAANNGNTLSSKYDETNPLAVQLRYVAQMISGGLETKVYILNINGFDTHDAQVENGIPEEGNHAVLLKRLSDAVAAFEDDLTLLGVDQRVAGMTYSEFGRQIKSNASDGTDHGDAAPMFLFGGCISKQVTGSNPVIAAQVSNQAGIPMEIDFRDVYASLLKDWFMVDPAEIQTMFEHTVNFYWMMGACNVGLDEKELSNNSLLLYPNPAYSQANLQVTTD